MDSRTCSILLNLNLTVDLASNIVANKYRSSIEGVTKAATEDLRKNYKNLRSTVKESFLTGSLKYGHNFIS